MSSKFIQVVLNSGIQERSPSRKAWKSNFMKELIELKNQEWEQHEQLNKIRLTRKLSEVGKLHQERTKQKQMYVNVTFKVENKLICIPQAQWHSLYWTQTQACRQNVHCAIQGRWDIIFGFCPALLLSLPTSYPTRKKKKQYF